MTDRQDPRKVLQIVGLVNGAPTVFDGQYIVEYDPGRSGLSPDGQPMVCHLVTTPDRDKATRYGLREAVELHRSVDPDNPMRPDGRPNRPLTAFHVMFLPADGDSS